MLEKQKREALERMKLLNIHDDVVNDFTKSQKLYRSELMGILYWLNSKEQEIIKKWEEETGHLAYHVILTYTNFGRLLSILFVSKYEEDWEMEKECIKNNTLIAYVKNLDDDFLSECGSITFRENMGGLIRIG